MKKKNNNNCNYYLFLFFRHKNSIGTFETAHTRPVDTNTVLFIMPVSCDHTNEYTYTAYLCLAGYLTTAVFTTNSLPVSRQIQPCTVYLLRFYGFCYRHRSLLLLSVIYT